jgi:hypothetical protein
MENARQLGPIRPPAWLQKSHTQTQRIDAGHASIPERPRSACGWAFVEHPSCRDSLRAGFSGAGDRTSHFYGGPRAAQSRPRAGVNPDEAGQGAEEDRPGTPWGKLPLPRYGLGNAVSRRRPLAAADVPFPRHDLQRQPVFLKKNSKYSRP